MAEVEVTQEGTTWVAVLSAPVTPAQLANAANRLPVAAVLASVEVDHDGTVYTSWEAA